MTSFLIGFGVLKESVIKETFVFCGRKFFRLRDDFVSEWFWGAEGIGYLRNVCFFMWKKILSFKR